MNLGEGLTNESGAYLRRINDREIEGMKFLGTFCYNPQAVFPIYLSCESTRLLSRRGIGNSSAR